MFSVRYLRERVDERRLGVGDEQHVRLLDLLEPADRRSVEPEPVFEESFGELCRGDREVLHETRKVAEAEVDDLRTALLQQAQDVLGCSHGSFPLITRRRIEA